MLAGESQANQSARISSHKIDILSTHPFRRDDQVAFVLTVLIVHEDNHLAEADVIYYFFY